MNKTEKSSFWI